MTRHKTSLTPLEKQLRLTGGAGDVVELLENLCSQRMLEEVGWRSDIDLHQPNHSDTLIAKELQNCHSNLFQLFNNVSWLPL